MALACVGDPPGAIEDENLGAVASFDTAGSARRDHGERG
jgi:hypothetical protein